MFRVEVIGNRSIEENVLEALRDAALAKFYTRIPTAYGVGSCGPRMGDAVWSEENFVLVVWVEDEEEARRIEACVNSVKEKYPEEGVKVFWN